MSWPAISNCVKMLDISEYNSRRDEDGTLIERSDLKVLREENPEVKVLMIRMADVWLEKDLDFEFHFDEAAKHDFDIILYVNANPSRSAQEHVDKLSAMLGGRTAKVVRIDAETRAGQSPSTITSRYKEIHDLLRVEWEWAEVIDWYTAAWFWNPNVKHGWENSHLFHIAHYPYFVQGPDGKWRVAYSFEEVDPLLPIDNGFTPRVPDGIALQQVHSWQFSDHGKVKGIASPNVDLNYVLKWFYDQTWGSPQPPPPPTETADAVRKEAALIRSSASRLDDIADNLEDG